MKWVNLIGSIIFDFLTLTLLLAVSFVLVLPFFPVVVGITKYFDDKREDRTLRIVFHTIKQNIRLIFPFTLFWTVLMILSILNIAYFNDLSTISSQIIRVISYIALGYGLISFVFAPRIIIRMKVTFFQLLYNSFMLIFSNLIWAVFTIIVNIGFLWLFLEYPWTSLFLILGLLRFNSLFSNKLMNNLSMQP